MIVSAMWNLIVGIAVCRPVSSSNTVVGVSVIGGVVVVVVVDVVGVVVVVDVVLGVSVVVDRRATPVYPRVVVSGLSVRLARFV